MDEATLDDARRFERARARAHRPGHRRDSRPRRWRSARPSNLSAGGACLALQTRDLMVGDEVILWLNFARPRQPVPATGRIVWTSGGWGRAALRHRVDARGSAALLDRLGDAGLAPPR